MEAVLAHSAAPSFYGYGFQLYRVLDRLLSDPGAQRVAIETIDDIVKHDAQGITLEQDKATVVNTNPLTNSSVNFWKTLLIWVDQEADDGQTICGYTLVTNSSVTPQRNSFIARIMSRAPGDETAIVEDLLRFTCGDDQIMNIVGQLVKKKSVLLRVIAKTDVLFNVQDDVASLASKIQCPANLREQVAADLVGWLFVLCMNSWKGRRSACVARDAMLEQMCEITQRHRTDRWRIRPEAALVLTAEDILAQRGKRFVEHLIHIDTLDEDIENAIGDYLRVQSEKTRLLEEGEVLPSDFVALDDNCHRHWKRTASEVAVAYKSLLPVERGKLIYAKSLAVQATLASQDITDEYFRSGTYQRLAEVDLVWWNPNYLDGI